MVLIPHEGFIPATDLSSLGEIYSIQFIPTSRFRFGKKKKSSLSQFSNAARVVPIAETAEKLNKEIAQTVEMNVSSLSHPIADHPTLEATYQYQPRGNCLTPI